MSLEYSRNLVPRAKELRRNMTPQERHLWYNYLAKYSVCFQRQKVINGFIVDFYCHKAKLVIEVDGSQHNIGNGPAYDEERTVVLNGLGLQVIRFNNREIDRNFSGVCKTIDETVRAAVLCL